MAVFTKEAGSLSVCQTFDSVGAKIRKYHIQNWQSCENSRLKVA